MKKSLVAIAALALVGAASAQSSVTLYGVVDLSIAKTTGGDTQMSAGGSELAPGFNSPMNNGSSRLGVRGTEDLGGGLKVSFNFEQGINAETGAPTDANTFQRAANMSVSGGFGTFLMGRTLTPSFYGVAAWELSGAANYTAVGNKFAWAGGPSRNSSQFTYTTPNIAGFSGTIGYITDADMGAAVDNAKYDLNVIYRGGPLTAALSYNKAENADGNAALGAKYDFGMFQVAGSLQDPGDDRKGFSIGAGANLGVVSLVLDIVRDTHYETTDVLVEAKYPLSKRTFAYAAALRQEFPTADDRTTYGVGLRHNF